MKQKLLLLSVFLCFSHCILSQSTDDPVEVMRYSYHVVWVKDKTMPESKSETVAFLDIYNHQSRFSERGFVQRREAEIKTAKDNAMSKEEKIGLVLSYKPRFNWVVYAHGNRLLTYNNSGKNYYQTEEDRTALNWKLNPEPLTWNGFTVQEATTTYGGRNWTVWFTKDIPLSDGPYKFRNLPGFVVKAWDDEEHYSFEFANSEKTTTIWYLTNNKNEYKSISKAQEEKMLKLRNNKTHEALLIETLPQMSGRTENNLPKKFKEKVGLRSNPIERF